METKHILGFLAVIIVVVAGAAILTTRTTESVLAAKYDMAGFAQCLKDKGATFYGAFWCPHCGKTKQLFGPDAVSKLPYVECSTPDGKGQLAICKDKAVESYPTWEFANGKRLNGELSESEVASAGKMTLGDIATASGCSVMALDGTEAIMPNMSAATPVATSTPASATTTKATSSTTTSKAR